MPSVIVETDDSGPVGEDFLYVFKPAPDGRGSRTRPDGKQPSSLRPNGLQTGLYLWTAGYVPVGGLWTGASHPRWPQIVSAAPGGVNPAARPIPPGGYADEDGRGAEMVG